MLFVGCSKQTPEPSGGSPYAVTPGPGRSKTPPVAKKDPLTSSEPDAVLAAFRAKFGPNTRYDDWVAASKRIAEVVPPAHPRRADVFRAAVELQAGDKDLHRQAELAAILTAYATGDDIPELVAVVNNDPQNLTLYGAVIRRLKQLKDDPRAAEAAAEWMASRLTGLGRAENQAAGLLRAIGPPAQGAVLPCARAERAPGKKNAADVRETAVAVLGDIGTEETIPALEAMFGEGDGFKFHLQQAIDKIRKRAAKP